MKKLNNILKFSAFLFLIAIAVSCMKEEDPYVGYTAQREADMIKEWMASMKTKKLDIDSTSTGIYYLMDTSRVASEGPKVTAGDTVTVKYVGMFMDGAIFDASANHNQAGTMVYVHKTKRMITGWEEGIELLGKGDRATFLFPSALA